MGRGFGIAAHVDHDVVRVVAREVEALGYSSFWVNDFPAADGLAALAEAASVTTGIDLGVGVVPLDQRPPAAIAARLRELHLPPARLVLGVGSGGTHDALARVRAGVEALRGEVGGRIVVGALGPRMAELGGAAADGVLLNWMTPGYAGQVATLVVRAAAAAGRPRPLVMAYVRCGLVPAADDRLRQELAMYARVPTYRRLLERMGADGADTLVVGGGRPALQPGLEAFGAVLDETIVRAMTPDDDADSILALVRAAAPEPHPSPP
jgi:alkanesulfonate monooxygenase SsuD/methylene tetrahydromethanopterin reductase-like flavin-dependent oxidoreductase (luciferase family)